MAIALRMVFACAPWIGQVLLANCLVEWIIRHLVTPHTDQFANVPACVTTARNAGPSVTQTVSAATITTPKVGWGL